MHLFIAQKYLFWVECACVCVCVCVLSCVQLCVTPWTVAHQAPLFMEFARQEH